MTIFEEIRTEIAHVVMVDLVGHSLTTLQEQSRNVASLSDIVTRSNAFKRAKAENAMMPIPCGDGLALLFFGSITPAAECSMEVIAEARTSGLRIRVGIHSGLVHKQRDITGNDNVVGEGINTAQRIMNEALEGQILLSPQFAHWLSQFDRWNNQIHPAGKAVGKHGIPLDLFCLSERPLQAVELPKHVERGSGLRIVVLYRRKVSPDDSLVSMIESSFKGLGYHVFIDRHLQIGVEWAKAIEKEIRSSDAVIAIISDQAAGSEMLEYELEIAQSEFLVRGKPAILPVRVGSDKPVQGAIGSIVNSLNFTVWSSPADDARVIAELASALEEPVKPVASYKQLEPVGGAVALDSPLYIERETDTELDQSIRANESIVLVKGPRQVGKTSLVGRKVKLVRELGWNCILTDFQKLNSTQLADEKSFYELIAATLARQFKFKYDFEGEWRSVFGANMNMDNFVRALLEELDQPLVWFMDETDRLFGAPFASDFFGLVRSWHNSRATDPFGPWNKLTLVIAYATEAHLFIRDLNQSPFNVGRRLAMRNFTLAETAELNERYGRPVAGADGVMRLYSLVGGQPFLVRRALEGLTKGSTTFADLIDDPIREDGPFGDHLKRILVSLTQIPEVLNAVKASLASPQLPDSEAVQRLVAAGIIRRNQGGDIEFGCELYVRYLSKHLENFR